MDMYTLHVVHAALLGVLTALTVANVSLHRGSPGVRWFPLYPLCGFIGAVLVLLRGHVPLAASLVLGAMLFPLGYVLLHRALTEFFGRGREGWRAQLALACLAAAALFWWGLVAPNTQHRLAVYSAILALQLAVSAVFVLRHSTGALRGSGWVMGAVLLLLVANNLSRATGVLLWGAPADYMLGATHLTWTLLATSILQGGLVIAFVWMTAAALRRDLEIQASTDPLTGLLNRRAIEHELERAITRCRAKSRAISAILIDLDEFKQINDEHGHRAGDAVLQQTAHCLRDGLRQGDRVGRLGGDEFVVLLPETELKVAHALAERLRGTLEGLVVDVGSATVQPQASFGVSELREHAAGWNELMVQCDRALYTVKSRGGNQVVFE